MNDKDNLYNSGISPFLQNADKDKTLEALKNPKAGQLFHEMYSYWLAVVEVTEEGKVTAWEVNQENLLIFNSKKDFETNFLYGSIPGSPLRLSDSVYPVETVLSYVNSEEFKGKIIQKSEKIRIELEKRQEDLFKQKAEYLNNHSEIEAKILDVKVKLLGIKEATLSNG